MKSLNKVLLIGNLTRDPEMRYTKNGNQVCSFGLATNRTWKEKNGEQKEETEFHTITAWNDLAEICSKYLIKGLKIYIEGRLATHTWKEEDGHQRSKTEIIIDDMIILDHKGGAAAPVGETDKPKTPKQKPTKQAPVEEEPALEDI